MNTKTDPKSLLSQAETLTEQAVSMLILMQYSKLEDTCDADGRMIIDQAVICRALESVTALLGQVGRLHEKVGHALRDYEDDGPEAEAA